MALTNTTLGSACGVNDTSIVVASATGFVANAQVLIDGEVMLVDRTYVSGTTIPVRRGQDGGFNRTHPSGALVAVGLTSDTAWGAYSPQQVVQYPLNHPLIPVSYSASGAITLPQPGQDLDVSLNGTSTLAMTVAAPVTAQSGSRMWISSNGAAAHTVTFTGGLSGASTSYDVLTVNAGAPVTLGPFTAVNGWWQAPANVAISGTVTNLTAGVA